MTKTALLFMDDAYLDHCEAQIVGITDSGAVILNGSVFYAQSGGQPGDSGVMRFGDAEITIENTLHDRASGLHMHVPSPAASEMLPAIGSSVVLHLDWGRRYAHMRMHSCMHLLCAVVPYPVSGGQISAESGRLDFDIDDSDAVQKDVITSALNRLICADHRIYAGTMTTQDLQSNMDMVRTMAVAPPMDGDTVRIIHIGEGGRVDRQPCGGTHVRSTGEIGAVYVRKIEKKGRQNRRIRVAFGHAPAL